MGINEVFLEMYHLHECTAQYEQTNFVFYQWPNKWYKNGSFVCFIRPFRQEPKELKKCWYPYYKS